MILAHPLTGFSVTAICKSFWENLTSNQKRIIWVTGVTASIFPDLDLFYAFLTKSASHHQYITHTPILYLTLALIFSFILYLFEKDLIKFKSPNSKFQIPNFKRNVEFLERLIIIFLANTLMHLLMDIPAGSIRPFWPVYTEIINIFKIQSANWLRNYFSSPAILIEIFWGISAIIIATRNWKRKDLKYGLLITLFWFAIAILSTLLLII